MFGGYPLNKITREYIQEWVNQLTDAGKKLSTVRHAFFTVRMMLEQAVVDGRLTKNPAEHVKLPKEHARKGGQVGVVDDRSQFLTRQQVSALVGATPWPYNVLVHVAAWAGLRAGELAGLQVGDVDLPEPSMNPNAPAKPGMLHVERAVRAPRRPDGLRDAEDPGSNRRVPLTPATTALLRDYLAAHPRRRRSDRTVVLRGDTATVQADWREGHRPQREPDRADSDRGVGSAVGRRGGRTISARLVGPAASPDVP